MEGGERWTRGAGSGGIGTSGHINEYRNGVLIGNFVENSAGKEFEQTGRSTYGFGAHFAGNSSQRVSYTANGKTGEALQYISQRQDQDLSKKGVNGDLLLRHGDFWQPCSTYYATMNQLTHTHGPTPGEPRVETHVWTGRNAHDARVETNTVTLDLTTRRQNEWQAEAASDAFATSTRSAAMAAALKAAESPSKVDTIRPTSELTGTLGTIGRRPVGPCKDECDKNYRKTGLRNIYYSS